ncbi:MAG: acetate--CoA ligase family protein [Calditrichia bacterium]|nr:acetate--CoA ligase family protein [Calditrichia bacterium]
MSEFEKLLAPKSVVIIGASRKEGSLGKMYLDAVLKFKYTGLIYLVNPKADEIEGIKCYPDIDLLPQTPDLAILLLPKDFVIAAVEQLARNNIKNIVVISAGFKEVGGEGIEREKQLLEIVKKNNLRMVGPNSMGLFNTIHDLSFNGTFSPTPPIPGHVGFVSQSGALGVAVLELSMDRGLGFSVFVSTGNKTDISDVEILQYLSDDDNTKVAMLYQESIDKPAKFREICTSFVQKKPLIVLKAGRTKSGLKAASSHTGALASDDIVADTFLRQCGAIRCQTLDELLDTALAFENQPIPKGNKIAVVTNAGGPGILASDALEKSGLELAQLSENTIQQLKKILPEEASLSNPVDMIASATHETYKNTCEILIADDNVDAILLIIVKPPVKTTPLQIIENLKLLIESNSKPIYATLMARATTEAGLGKFRELKIPVYNFPESAAVAIGNVVKYNSIKNKIKPIKLSAKFQSVNFENKSQAPVSEIANLFKKYNLPVCDHIVTNKLDEALRFLGKAKNVAMKVANHEVIHKSDSGLVLLNINNEHLMKSKFPELLENIKSNLSSGISPNILIQKMIKGKIELVIGSRNDPQFGQVLMFGSGGTLVELIKDVAFRVLPIDHEEALELIKEIKGYKLLTGYRSISAVNLNNLADLLVKASQMLVENPQILEMDLNPLIWQEGDDYPTIVDFRMTVAN